MNFPSETSVSNIQKLLTIIFIERGGMLKEPIRLAQYISLVQRNMDPYGLTSKGDEIMKRSAVILLAITEFVDCDQSNHQVIMSQKK